MEQLRNRTVAVPALVELPKGRWEWPPFELDEELQQAIEEHPERLEWLHKVLTDGVSPFWEDKELAEIQAIQAQEYERIGRAFQEGLLAELPAPLANLESWFGDLTAVEDDLMQPGEEPDVRAGGAVANDLADHGLRPLGIFYATEGVFSFWTGCMRGLAESGADRFP